MSGLWHAVTLEPVTAILVIPLFGLAEFVGFSGLFSGTIAPSNSGSGAA